MFEHCDQGPDSEISVARNYYFLLLLKNVVRFIGFLSLVRGK